MTKKKASQPIVPPTKKEINKTNDLQDHLYLIFITLYLLIDIIPRGHNIDTSYQHRFFIDLINIASSIYLIRNFAKYRSHAVSFFSNILPLLYAGFIFFAFLSLFVAYSPIEGLINLAGYVSNFWVFANFFMLLYGARSNIKAVAMLITFTLFYQVSIELYDFYLNLGKDELLTQIDKLTWNTGNKNIFAATIVIKLAFAFYSSLRTKGLLKFFSYITVFITILLLFILSARAAYISLAGVVFIIVIGNLWLYASAKETRLSAITSSLTFITILIASFVISNSTLTHYQRIVEQSKQARGIAIKETESFLTDRFSSIGSTSDASTGIRLVLWKEALKAWTKKPLLGYGVGNYRIYTTELTHQYYTSNVYFNHTHNDFIEILFESGILAFLAYVGLFLVALGFNVRILINKSYSKERKFVSLILLAAGLSFFVDSFFNFPLPRTNVNVLFVLILSLTAINFLGIKTVTMEKLAPSEKLVWPKYAYLAILILGIASFYINYELYQSGKAQYFVDGDSHNQNVNNPKIKFNYAQVCKMLDYTFPVLGANGGEPISIKKGKYAYFNNQDEEAIKLADIGTKDAPYALHGQRLKLFVYIRQQQLDSVYKYVQIVHDQMPYSKADYNLRIKLAGKFGKINDIKKVFKLYDAYHQTQDSYENYAAQLALNKYDFNQDKEVLAEGLKRYPDSKILQALKNYYDALAVAEKKT